MIYLNPGSYSGDGSDLNELAQSFEHLYGSFVTFGKGESGKTLMAESLASVIHESVIATAGACRDIVPNDAIITAALSTWFNPAFFRECLRTRVLSEEDVQSWASTFLKEVGVGSYAVTSVLAASTDARAGRDFTSRLNMLMSAGYSAVDAVSPNAVQKLPVHKAKLGEHDYVLTSLLNSASVASSLYACLPVEGREKAPILIITKLPADAERADVDDWVAASRLAVTHDSFAVREYTSAKSSTFAEWFCAIIPGNDVTINTDASTHPYFQNDKGYELCLTQNGVQVRVPDAVGEFENHTEIPAQDWMYELLEVPFADASDEAEAPKVEEVSKMDDIFDYTLDNDAVLLLSLLAESGVMKVAVTQSSAHSSTAHRCLSELVEMLELEELPTLIMTEMKARNQYGAIAFNRDIEEAGAELSLRFKKGSTHGVSSIKYTSTASLVSASVGSLILWPVTHVSVLDLTLIFDIVFNSATQKGGLDSSMLQIMQYLSNIATMANAYFIVETRDDFTVTANDDEANERARTTLGANSKVAIQMMGSGAEARSLWARVKGGDDMEDYRVELMNIGLNDYPKNMFRPEKKETLLERIARRSGKTLENNKLGF